VTLIREFAPFVYRVVRTLLAGWFRVAAETGKALFLFLKAVHPAIYLFALSSLAVFLLPLVPWIEYTTNFMEKETVQIGTNNPFYFILPGFLGPFLLLIPFRIRRIVYYVFSLPVAILYGAGFVYPNPVFTLMLDPREYHILPGRTVYGAALALSLLSAYFAFAYRLIDYRFLTRIPGAIDDRLPASPKKRRTTGKTKKSGKKKRR